MKDNQFTYSDHLECVASLPVVLQNCDNCGQPTPESDLTLVEVHKHRYSSIVMQVCPSCSKPVLLQIVQLPGSGLWWIYYVDGLGANRRTVEAHGLTIPEAIDNFREKWEVVMDRDLVRFCWK